MNLFSGTISRARDLLLLVVALLVIQAPAKATSWITSYDVSGFSVQYGTSPNGIVLRYPMRLLEDALRNAIREAGRNSPQISFDASRVSLTSAPYSPYIFRLRFSISGYPRQFPSIKVSCDVQTDFAIPLAPILEVGVSEFGNSVTCEVSGDIAVLADIPAKLSQAVRDALKEQLNKRLLTADQLSNLLKGDSLVTDLTKKGLVQARVCEDVGWQWLCVRLIWTLGDPVGEYLRALEALAPAPQGPANPDQLKELENIVTPRLPRKPSVHIPGYAYPSKAHPVRPNGMQYDDGDMALFGGLLCTAKIEEGCTLLRRSQSSTGQWWRSPDRINDWLDDNQFSADQFNGAVAYLLAENDKKQAQAAARRYLRFIKTRKQTFPDLYTGFMTGYRSCLMDSEYTCALAGGHWNWLNVLARLHDVGAEIPPEERDPAKKYGFTYESLPYEAAFNLPGFRLHLVGVQIWLLRAAGHSSVVLDRSAAILAARQPSNPFFLFLHLGKDESVSKELVSKCSEPPEAGVMMEWAWERDQGEKRYCAAGDKESWKCSMQWDCLFLIRAMQQ